MHASPPPASPEPLSAPDRCGRSGPRTAGPPIGPDRAPIDADVASTCPAPAPAPCPSEVPMSSVLVPALFAFALSVGAVAPPVAPSPASPCLVPPIEAPVVDPFRMPACPYCAGNRGIEYGPRPGQAVVAMADGLVVFAGSVAGTRWLVVEHRDGLRASYGWLATMSVTRGDRGARRPGAGAEHRSVLRRAARRRRGRSTPPIASAAAGTGPGSSRATAASVVRRESRAWSVASQVAADSMSDRSAARWAESDRTAHSTVAGPASRVGARASCAANRGRGEHHGRRHHATDAGSRCPLRAPDPPLEPEDEALHLR